MCLWLLTSCLGILHNPAPPIVVVQAVPSPILTPTTTTTITTTTARPAPPTGNTNNPGTAGQPMTMPPNQNPSNPPPANPGGTFPTMPAATMPPYTNPPQPPNNIPTGGVILPVLICADPNLVCVVANPDQPITGAPMIDPRLGTTPQASAAYQIPIVGYSAQLPSYDTAVRFPRERRSVESFGRLSEVDGHTRRIRKRQVTSCSCVAAGSCPTNNGAGMIDFRIVTPGTGGNTCPAGQVWCCFNGGGGGTPQNLISCGTRQAMNANVVASSGQADLGEYPWMAMILTNQNDYIAGGVLIDQYNVLTVIHRLTPYIVSGAAPNVKVRLGEWDAAGTYEPIPYQEFTIRRVFTHPSFNAQTLQYDIAVLRLSTPVSITPMIGSTTTINRACLPTSSAAVFTGQRCWVSGWGKSAFGPQGQYQQILKEVDVPIVDPNTCQNQLRTARLGASYVLDTTSFICAGGETNKDSCTGDGGSGLVCQVNGQWTLIGLVAWGLGCANTNVPGVYVNIAALLPWIQQQVATT